MIIHAFFVPVLHAGGITWDEMLLFIVGLALLIIVGYFGQRSEREPGRMVQPQAKTGSRPHERQALSIRDVTQR